jgi:hypothetical protein
VVTHTATLTINNCTECPHHKVLPDPDPDDWFCDDDVKVVCTLTERKANTITSACRPYNKKKESEVPEWCPLRK